MRLDRVAAALVAALAAASFEAAARAAAQAFVALEYETASDTGGCLDADQFRASVEHQLGYDPFRTTASRRVAVRVARKEVGFDGSIQWSDAHGRWVGERHLSSRRPDCSDIAASLAFSVAVQVQLLATLAPPDVPEPRAASSPAPAPAAPPATPAPAPAVARVPPAPAVARVPDDGAASSLERRGGPTASPARDQAPEVGGKRLELSIGIGPSVALGVAPGLTAQGRLFASARAGWFSLEVAMDAALPATQHDVDGSGFSLDRFAGEAAACGHARAFAACLTTTLGRLQARGFGVDMPAAPAGLFSQVGARIGATLPFGDRYFASARLDGLVMVSSWTVTLNDTAAWTTPRVSALFGMDLGAHFF